MKKKSKVSLLIIGILIVLASVGLSYAYWQMTLMGDKGNNVTSGCFNIEMINQKDEITLGSTFPIKDEEGLKLKPFSFTLKNTCTIFAHYYVNMEMLEGTTLNSKFVAVRVNNEEINTLDTYKTANTTIDGSTESRTIAEGYLGADEEVDYTVSFWMDEDVTIDDDVMNKVFKSKIVINSEPGKYDPVSAGYDMLHDVILANEYQTTPEIAKDKIANKQAVDLSNTAPIIKWVEKTEESTTRQVIKPTAEAISSVSELNNLSTDEQYIYVCTAKTFDSITAKYTLSDCSFKDPTVLDYSGDTKYYYINEYVAYNQANSKLYIVRNIEDNTICNITNASKSTFTQSSNNINYSAFSYNLSCTILTSEELESDKSDKGLYQSEDDYGTTYYYRGNVKNNNVYFAGFYWQIIRINGDNSIRLIYNGTEKSADGSKKMIGNSSFNSAYDNPAYVGYMYGDISSTSIDNLYSNFNSSVIKINIDSWYKSNILSTGYDDYISNYSGFCGDRTIYSGDGVSTNKFTSFGTMKRSNENSPEFKCENIERDLYTPTDSSIGNKALTYPVGLITYDELIFSGASFLTKNKLSWSYSSEIYWTMTPTNYNASWGNSNNWIMNTEGIVYSGGHIGRSYGIRPVINLKSDVKISGGIGTTNNPFVIETND